MANQLTTPSPIRVGHATIYMKKTAVTVASAATLVSLFTAASEIQNHIKDLTITPPEGAVDMVNLIGETTSTNQPLQTHQNYVFEEKPFTAAKISGTMILKPDEDPFELAFAGAGTAAVTASYTRYQYGGSDATKLRVPCAILLLCSVSATDIMAVLLNNAYITKLGDIKATGTDGHMERDFEATCSPDNFVIDYLD